MIRICTWNLWHGLNPYGQPVMLPMETPWAMIRRRALQVRELQDLRRAKNPRHLDLFCFQEVNPFPFRMNSLKRHLEMDGGGCLVNAGVKVGWWGIPPFLFEGLAILHSNSMTDTRVSELTLSGKGLELHGPLGTLLAFQTSERRKAVLTEGTFGGRRIAIVNLHLHHGPDTIPENFKRKLGEVKALVAWLKPKIKKCDFVAIVGDFNCDPDSEVIDPLHELGFDSASSLDSRSLVGPTWDPENNPNAALSPESAPDPRIRDWDATAHEFDRIYIRKKDFKRVRVTRVLDSGLSDHFGVLAEIAL